MKLYKNHHWECQSAPHTAQRLNSLNRAIQPQLHRVTPLPSLQTHVLRASMAGPLHNCASNNHKACNNPVAAHSFAFASSFFSAAACLECYVRCLTRAVQFRRMPRQLHHVLGVYRCVHSCALAEALRGAHCPRGIGRHRHTRQPHASSGQAPGRAPSLLRRPGPLTLSLEHASWVRQDCTSCHGVCGVLGGVRAKKQAGCQREK